MNDDILLTREQIGQALEYKDPIKSIQNIHMKHKDRLDHLSLKIKTETFDHHQSDVCRNNNLMTERVYYTEKRNYGNLQMVKTTKSKHVYGLGMGYCRKI